jgi:hypothetical protein
MDTTNLEGNQGKSEAAAKQQDVLKEETEVKATEALEDDMGTSI